MNLKAYLLLMFFVLSASKAFTQQSVFAIPEIQNFSNKEYQAGTQNWDIIQDERGIIYFANNAGLLEFDGFYWKVFPVKNHTVLRSIAQHKDGKIFAGAQGEFGYFLGDDKGTLLYTSFLEKIPLENRQFSDIWDILIKDDKVFFSSNNGIFIYENEKIVLDQSIKNIEHMTELNGETLIYSSSQGFYKWSVDSFKKVKTNSEIPLGAVVTDIIPIGLDSNLITTIQSGLFWMTQNEIKPWDFEHNNFFKENQIYGSTLLPKQQVALGTTTSGIFILDKSGKISKRISKKEGLLNNSILCLFRDQSDNLWAGMENGITHIETNSAFSRIASELGTGYAVYKNEQHLYLGTSNALFYAEWNPTTITPEGPYQILPIDNTTGQVWNLSPIEDQLFLNHHEGVFEIKGTKAIENRTPGGSWLHRKDLGNPDVFMEGTYNGLNLYQKKPNGQWDITHINEPDEESCRFLETDRPGRYWVAHPYRGAYKIELDKDFKAIKSAELYNSNKGFPSDLFIHVFKVRGEVLFPAETGVYFYDEPSDQFKIDPKWDGLFAEGQRIKKLIEDPTGNIWYAAGDEVGLLEVKSTGLDFSINKKAFPILSKQLVGGFEYIYPLDDKNVFFGLENGFAHLDPSYIKTGKNHFPPLIRSIYPLTPNAGPVFSGNISRDYLRTEFPIELNGLRFTFSTPTFAHRDKVRFSFKLEGLEDEWSEWTDNREKEYNNLPYGSYSFMVKSKGSDGIESEPDLYSFEIFPPWYASKVAFLIYTFLGFLILAGLVFIPRRKYEKEKAILETEQAKTLKEQQDAYLEQSRESERTISKLKAEKLENEIQMKKQELASSALLLLQKQEMLAHLKNRLEKIESKNPEIAKEIKKIIRVIQSDMNFDESWETFSLHFDQVHQNFLKTTREKYPQLSPKELKLCAYLRMNLTTKEIAPLLNISVRGVEIGRYRLRKKLGIPTETNLIDFVMSI